MRARILTVLAAFLVVGGLAYMTFVDDPLRPFIDWGLDEPEREPERGRGHTTLPDPPDNGGEIEYCGEDGDCDVLEPSEKDSPESTCIQMGLVWDGTHCVQEQLGEEIIGRIVEGKNGEVCEIIDVLGNVRCPPGVD